MGQFVREQHRGLRKYGSHELVLTARYARADSATSINNGPVW